MIKTKKCKECKNIVNKNNKLFCSSKCMYSYFRKNKIGAFHCKEKSWVRKKVTLINRINKTGAFHNLNIKRENGKKTAKTNKKNKTGAFHDKKIQSKGGRTTHLRHPKLFREIRLNMRRNQKKYCFNNIYFDSKSEMEIGMGIHYQIEKLKLWKNYQFIINGKIIDFFIEKYKCFIEYHPKQSIETFDEYYKRRRKVLNDGGYKDYFLIVIK